ncbi:hypothetical protein XFF6970_290079 [Xanthomonas citri pv. fuscans]|nr:hypothetical protein XFF6970_290079 [Xanthomonas citri pv. fuscans]
MEKSGILPFLGSVFERIFALLLLTLVLDSITIGTVLMSKSSARRPEDGLYTQRGAEAPIGELTCLLWLIVVTRSVTRPSHTASRLPW